MAHCATGPGASNMGGATQKDARSKNNLQSHFFDAKHDMILALIEWTENGTPPEEIVSTKYVNDLSSNKVQFQRKLCPWPLVRWNLDSACGLLLLSSSHFVSVMVIFSLASTNPETQIYRKVIRVNSLAKNPYLALNDVHKVDDIIIKRKNDCIHIFIVSVVTYSVWIREV